jgi:glycosyltransferase involved in cell wall biosynthesis
MKVALDFRSIPQTGIWNYSEQLARGLAEQAVTVSRISMPVALLQGSSLAYRQGIRRLGWENTAMPALFRRESVDLFHCTNNYGIPLFCPCPTVLTVHDFVPLTNPEAYLPQFRKRAAYRLFLGYSIRAATRIITISDFTHQELLRRYPVAAAKARRVYHGCGAEYKPLEDCRMAEPTLQKFGLTQPFVLTIGGTEPRKNVRAIVEVFKARWQAGQQTPLLAVVGEDWRGLGPAEWGITPNILLLGRVETTELIDLYASCLFFAFPSLLEGFGFPVLEAMGCGAPVVAMRASSIPEVAGAATILVDPGKPAELAEACQRLIEDSELRSKLVTLGRARAAEFTWERTVQETLRVYAEAVKGRSASI